MSTLVDFNEIASLDVIPIVRKVKEKTFVPVTTDFNLLSAIISAADKEVKESFIVINERKPGGYDVYVNSSTKEHAVSFPTDGGKLKTKFMETEWGARQLALKLYEKLPHTRNNVEFIQIDDDVPLCEIISSEFYRTKERRKEYSWAKWDTGITFQYVKIQRYNRYFELVDDSGVIAPMILQLWVRCHKAKMTIDKLFELWMQHCNKGNNRPNALTFIRICHRLVIASKINLAVQSYLMDKTGKPTLPDIGKFTLPMQSQTKKQFNLFTAEPKEQKPDYLFKYTKFKSNPKIRLEVRKEMAKKEGKFEDNWEEREFTVSGSNDKIILPAFKIKKQKKTKKTSDKTKIIELKDVKKNKKFSFMDKMYICLRHEGNMTVILKHNEEKRVPNNLRVIVER